MKIRFVALSIAFFATTVTVFCAYLFFGAIRGWLIVSLRSEQFGSFVLFGSALVLGVVGLLNRPRRRANH